MRCSSLYSDKSRRQLCQVVVLMSLLLVGCVTQKIPEDALRLSESSLEIRSIQTRNFVAPSENEILAAAVALLQDLHYNLDEISPPLGVLTGSKLTDADSDSEKVGLFLLDILCAVGGGGDCTASSTASDSQTTIVTIVVLPSLSRKGEFVTRMTLQRVIIDKQTRVKLMETIDDPEIYQRAFEKLSKSIFLQINE